MILCPQPLPDFSKQPLDYCPCQTLGGACRTSCFHSLPCSLPPCLSLFHSLLDTEREREREIPIHSTLLFFFWLEKKKCLLASGVEPSIPSPGQPVSACWPLPQIPMLSPQDLHSSPRSILHVKMLPLFPARTTVIKAPFPLLRALPQILLPIQKHISSLGYFFTHSIRIEYCLVLKQVTPMCSKSNAFCSFTKNHNRTTISQYDNAIVIASNR